MSSQEIAHVEEAIDSASGIPYELQALANAKNYQSWVFRTVAPFLGNRVVEFGAGIGSMSQHLAKKERLILTESDPILLDILLRTLPSQIRKDQRVSVGSFDLMRDSIESLLNENLDTAVSFNVLEHIENDFEALNRICEIIRPKEKPKYPHRVITFVPAHQWAFGCVDVSFKHYRRYSRKQLGSLCKRVAPEAKITTQYFNLFGLVGWTLNGKVLKRDSVGTGAIQVFEKICPVISGFDDFLHQKLDFPFGQSLLAVIEWS